MKQKSHRHLCENDRGVIERMRKAGNSQRDIAMAIGFSQSAISKELERNCGLRGYRHQQAHRKAIERKRSKPTRPRLLVGDLGQEVERRLKWKHSPEQISNTHNCPEGKRVVSHETIYRYIAADKKRGGTLYQHLRINFRTRRRTRVKRKKDRIPGRIGLEKRPKGVERRHRYGAWEADLIEGKKGSGYLLSLQERKSRLGILVKLNTKGSQETTTAIIMALRPHKVKTITYDNGLEFAGHRQVSQALNAKGYFCAPYHSWEKGAVENYNGLVRQYYPKGMSFAQIDETHLKNTEREINQRPRKTLGYTTPADLKHKIAA